MTHPSVGYEIAGRPRSEADLQPDIVSFGAAISACEKAREWQKAIRIFHGIGSRNCSQTLGQKSYVVLIIQHFAMDNHHDLNHRSGPCSMAMLNYRGGTLIL